MLIFVQLRGWETQNISSKFDVQFRGKETRDHLTEFHAPFLVERLGDNTTRYVKTALEASIDHLTKFLELRMKVICLH